MELVLDVPVPGHQLAETSLEVARHCCGGRACLHLGAGLVQVKTAGLLVVAGFVEPLVRSVRSVVFAGQRAALPFFARGSFLLV